MKVHKIIYWLKAGICSHASDLIQLNSKAFNLCLERGFGRIGIKFKFKFCIDYFLF